MTNEELKEKQNELIMLVDNLAKTINTINVSQSSDDTNKYICLPCEWQ